MKRYNSDFSPSTMKDTFESTNSLKGIAISAVLINHYLNLNLSGDYLWFANLFVGLFFIVSGYGIFCSLERSAASGSLRFSNLRDFYFNRLIRIYPLFITAYLIQCYLFDEPVTSWTLLAIHGRGHYWFIPAIIQCYLLAPLLFFLMKRFRFVSLNIVVFAFIAANLVLNTDMLPTAISSSIRFIHLQWRDVYFLYLLLFALSMYLPHYLASWEQVPAYEKKYWFILLLTVALTVMVVFKYQGSADYLYLLLTRTICPLMLLSIAAVYLLANGLEFPLSAWIGKSSYPIYLFHVIMYRSVDQLSGFGKNSLMELLIIITVLPLFFYCCSLIDRLNNTITSTLRRTYSRIRNRQPV